MAKGGYIKIHRSMLDWEWYGDDRCVRLLLHLHLKVNHQAGKWKGQEVLPGQLVTSSAALAEQLGWSRSAINRTLDKLKSCAEVDTKSDSKRTLVTLLKWDKFQNSDRKPDSKPDTNRTLTGQQTGHEPDTIEEGKKLKREEHPSDVRRKAPDRSVSDRKADFMARCREVVATEPDRLPVAERKSFADYWTELSADGRRMRFEAEKFFDHGRRMDTWAKRAIERPSAPLASTIKPWLQ